MTNTTIWATLSKATQEPDLTLPEADVLCFLRKNPKFDTARDAALYRDVSRAYISEAVEPLVEKGYPEIRRDKDDRRYQRLMITTPAKPLAEALHTV